MPRSLSPPRPRVPIVFGVTGLPAAGKSAVAAEFRGLGAEVADADRLVGEALDRPRIARGVIRILGPAVRGPGGRLDRAAAAARAFGPDPAPLRRLEAIVHPIVRRGLRDAVAGARRRRAPAVVLDVPLLFERGVDRMCDFTVFVRAARTVRLARARRRGWTAAELRRRESHQMPAAERRRRADFTVDGGGTRKAMRDQVRALWRRTVGDRRA
ncbi:MAG TPA: dephospho-CoA kinase [Planctomycetota bacterium]|nr:dephospho-CoA kinase [Planctomycetota bacterium]